MASMKFILTFCSCFCILALSESIESKNKELRRTNQVLLKTLRELAVGEVVMDDESAVATVNDDSRLSKLIICGSDKCESHFSSCEEALEALDEDKDKHDLKKCPQTHRTLGFCVEDNSWPRADQYLRLCTLNSVFEHNGDYGAAEFVCVWVDGDGHGKSESKVSGSITGNSCAKECYNRGFNGATIKANGENGCWCEKEMTGIKSSSSYKTCHLWPMTDDLRNSFHYKPGCDDWYLQDC